MSAVVLMGSLVFGVGAAVAAEDPQRVASEISAEIISPFCDGVTLHDCPSRPALELRDRIAQWSEQGWSRARIMDRLEDEYGPGIHAAPSATGSGLLAWVLPVVVLVAGAALAFVLTKRFAARSSVAQARPALSGEERSLLDRELDDFRREL